MGKRVYHHNDIRPVIMGMSLPARRLLYLCLERLYRESDRDSVVIKFDSSQVFTIAVNDYAKACDIDYSAAYRQMVSGADCLMKTQVKAMAHFIGDTSKPKDYVKPFMVAVKGTGYTHGEGYIDIKLDEDIRYFISDLTKNFTSQFLHSAMSISDGNAGKLYLMLREWISSGKYSDNVITVDQLREDLGLSNSKSYEQFKLFKSQFFSRATKQIIAKTEFTSIDMEIVERRARKAHKVKISYKYSSKESEGENQLVDKVPVRKESKVSPQKSKPVKRSAIDVLEEKISNFNFNED